MGIIISIWQALYIKAPSTTLTVNGRWGLFGDYGECTVTCGGGSRSRFRECNNPAPQHGGDDCTWNGSTDIETKTCNENICPPGKYVLESWEVSLWFYLTSTR